MSISKMVLIGALLFGLPLALVACVETSDEMSISMGESILNPYGGVNWSQIGHFDGNLHTHTRYSDGGFEPHRVIDEYYNMGYRILALTDHDTDHYQVREDTLFPWEDIADIYDEIKDIVSPRWDRTWRTVSNVPWQSRNPSDLGMVAIEGSEISKPHHIGSYFNNYCGGATSVDVALREIAARGGLSVFFHPGRYSRSVEWYVDYYRQFDSLIGMEVFNADDNWPLDRQLWDQVVHQLMPERLVWGFANDDMHYAHQYGLTRNVFLLEELDEQSVRTAMETGQFYFYIPNIQRQPPSLYLTSVTVEEETISLTVDGDYETINWITFEPRTNRSETIKTGHQVSLDDLPPFSRFVRAQVVGRNGRLYTQPFGIVRDVEAELPSYSVTFVVEDTDGEPIVGAAVRFDGLEEYSNAQGQVVFTDVALGTYGYTVSHADHVLSTGGLDVFVDVASDEEITQTVIMESPRKVMHLDFAGTLVSVEGIVPDSLPVFPRFVAGKVGSGIAIRSSNDSLEFLLDGVINPGEGTITFWFQPNYNYNDDSDRRGFWQWYCTSGDLWGNGIIFWTFNSNGANIWNRVDSERRHSTASTYPWQQGQWYHLAVTWSDNDGTMAYFIDGQQQSSGSFDLPTVDPTEQIRLQIGFGHSTSNPLDGVMDEYKIYNYAMTADQIMASFLAATQ